MFAFEFLLSADHLHLPEGKTALDASIEISRNDQRAWVGTKAFAVKTLKENEPLYVEVTITNTGRTPGFIRSQCSTVYASYSAIDVDKFARSTERSCPPTESTGTLFPGEEYFIPIYTTKSLSKSDVVAAKSETLFIYAFGEITYSDVFERSHKTDWCGVYSPKENRFTACREHHQAR